MKLQICSHQCTCRFCVAKSWERGFYFSNDSNQTFQETFSKQLNWCADRDVFLANIPFHLHKRWEVAGSYLSYSAHIINVLFCQYRTKIQILRHGLVLSEILEYSFRNCSPHHLKHFNMWIYSNVTAWVCHTWLVGMFSVPVSYDCSHSRLQGAALKFN